MTEAENSAASGKRLTMVKKIDFGNVGNDDNYQYQVIRLCE